MSGDEELLDQRAEGVGLGEPRDLVAELELLEDVLHVGREAVEVGLEVGLELLLAGAGSEIAQRELRGVVEGLTGGLPQGLVLVDDAGLVERGLHVEHGLLGRLKHGVEPAQHRHRQDHVAVLAAHIEVAQHVVRDAPDEVDDLGVLRSVHSLDGPQVLLAIIILLVATNEAVFPANRDGAVVNPLAAVYASPGTERPPWSSGSACRRRAFQRSSRACLSVSSPLQPASRISASALNSASPCRILSPYRVK